MDENALRSLTSEELEKLQREGFDRTDPSGPWIVAFTVGIVLTLVVVAFGVHYLFQATYDQNEYRQVLAAESQELREVRTREAEQLNHYRYTDKAKGAVRLPIGRAMEVFAQESAQGKLFYPGKSAPVKTAEDLAALPDGSTNAAGQPAASNRVGSSPVAEKK
jgi:stringent starvation protein B